MDLQSLGVVIGIVNVLVSIGDLILLGAALAVAIVCTRRRVCLPAAWLLCGAAGLAFVGGVATRLFYMGYQAVLDAVGENGAFVAGLGLDAVEMLALVLMGVAIFLFRPAGAAAIAGGEVARG
jgi:hypothetical protein